MSKVFVIALPEEVNNSTEIMGYPVFYSGVGKLNASIAIAKVKNMGFSEVINIGSCGSYEEPSGKIIKVGKATQDIDVRPLCEYGYAPPDYINNYITIDDSSHYTCFTTDYFYDRSVKMKYSKKYLDMIHTHHIFDMECYSLSKTCEQLGIKFSSYKWVSDDGSDHDWKENCQIGFSKVKEILKETL